MTAHRAILLALAPVALASLVAAAPRPASACGGTFCDGGGGPQVMPVDQSGESILFVMEEGWVEAHVQIEYKGDPAQFAWLVPIPLPAGAEPEISVGSQQLFDRLLGATVPTFTLSSSFEGDCNDGPQGCVSRDEALAGNDGGDFNEQDEPPGSPSVLARDVAGAYEYAVLQGGTVDGIGQWLDDNGYARDDDAPKILQAYLDESFSFVAFKLRAGTGLDQIHPVVLRYPGTEPCVPLRLTRIAAVDDMKIRAFFLGDARVVPTNYRHVELNPLRIDWLGVGANYDALVSEAVDQEGADGRAFVTEYAGPSAVVSTAGLRGFAWRSEDFLETTGLSLSDTLRTQGLIACDSIVDPSTGLPVDGESCGPVHPLLYGLLRTYLPAPPGVPDEAFYDCSDCYPELDESTWDPSGFAAAFEEQIVGPAEHAVDVLVDNGYLTRLYTMMSPGEMTSDPLFHERADLPGVTNQWSSTNRVFHCEENDRLELGDGVRIYLDDNDQPPDFEDMSAALRIEEFPLTGAPMVLLDAADDSRARLADWNDAHDRRGCDCRVSGRSQGSGWLGLLLLLGLRARGRRRIGN
jgi:hypothetical protein